MFEALLTVIQTQQTTTSVDQPVGGDTARPIGPRRASRTVRLAVVFFLFLSSVPLVVGIILSLPPARVAVSLQAFSESWMRLLTSAPQLSEQRRLATTEATKAPSASVARTALVVPKSEDRSVIAYGDRLKITFFESLSVAIDGSKALSGETVTTIFPRLDLSAEYAVDEGGAVNIPRFGQFMVAGQSMTAVQTALATAFWQATGRNSDVHIAIVERQPIYVLGMVRAAGTFKHTPGMTVLQALAGAGGTEMGAADTSKVIEAIRETQRLRLAEGKLDRLLLKQARLLALRQNSSTLTVPAGIRSRLAQASSPDGLKAQVFEAEATLGLERARHQQQLSLAERQVAVAKADLEAQKLRSDQAKALFAKKADRLRELEAIAARGSVSHYKLTDVNVDISELAAKQEDLRVAMAQSERRMVEAEIALAKLQRERSSELDNELAGTQQDIEESTLAIAAMRAVIQVLRNGTPDDGSMPGGVPDFKITRRLAEGPTVIPATTATMLMPGDVLQVNSPIRPGSPAPGAS